MGWILNKVFIEKTEKSFICSATRFYLLPSSMSFLERKGTRFVYLTLKKGTPFKYLLKTLHLFFYILVLKLIHIMKEQTR